MATDEVLRKLWVWRRRLELEIPGSWRGRLRVRRCRLGRPVLTIGRILRHTLRAGTEIRRRSGRSLVRQALDQWGYFQSFGLSPFDYCQFRLYRERNRGRVAQFLTLAHVWTLLRTLTPGPENWDKSEFRRACADRGLPAIPALAEWRDGKLRVHVPDWPREVFTKPAISYSGIGARVWDLGEDGRGRTALERCLVRDHPRGVVLVQPRLRNHPAMTGLTNGSLATLRLNGCRRPDGAFELLLPALRMPVGDALVDNFHQGGLLAPVDPERGRLGAGIRRDRDGVTWPAPVHPDTGARIEGTVLPLFDEALAACRRAHEAFPDLPVAGWDVGITADGPALVEANYIFGAELAQIPGDHPLGETVFPECVLHHLAARG